jgi:hypothetical protein
MTMSVEGTIAIISTASIAVIAVIKLLSNACFSSKCSRIKCFCLEIDRNVTIEQPNITFDENNNINNNISHQPNSTIQHGQDIHISIDRSPEQKPREIIKL